MKTESTLRSALIALSILSQITACSDAQRSAHRRTGRHLRDCGWTASDCRRTDSADVRERAQPEPDQRRNRGRDRDGERQPRRIRRQRKRGNAMEFGPVGNRWFINEIASRTKSLVEQFKLLAPGRPLPTALARFVDGEFIEEHAGADRIDTRWCCGRAAARSVRS